MILKWIKQRPVLSGIITMVILTAGFFAVSWVMNSLDSLVLMYVAWLAVMGISGVVFIVSGIALLLKHDSPGWKSTLLTALWILAVGGGTCFSVLAGIGISVGVSN